MVHEVVCRARIVSNGGLDMKQKKYVWVVVRVWRGIPSGAELFAHEELARNRERQLCQRLAPEDEVGVFQVAMPE